MPTKPPTHRPGGRTPKGDRQERARAYQRTRKDKDTQRLYQSKRWAAVRQIVLLDYPACVYCLERGRVTPTAIVDHIKPHKGDLELFWAMDNLHGLCRSCHNSAKQREELNEKRNVQQKS